MNWMKKGLFWGLLTVCLTAQSAPLMNNPDSLRYLDVELPFRCSSDAVVEGEGIASSVALSKTDFTVRLPGQTGLLPRYQVNGFSFSNKAADVAILELLDSAQIKVIAEEGKYPTLSANDLKGELSVVMEELVRQSNLFYTYQPDTKTLFLTHKAKAVIQVPANKLVMMAVLDALNGAHFEPFSVDWTNFQITLNLTRPELTEVQSLMGMMVKEKYILAAQIKLYDLSSTSFETHWQFVLDRLGTRKISVTQSGLVGQALTLAPSVDDQTFLSAMQGTFSLVLIAAGKVAVPSGWRTRFNFNQCSVKASYPDLSVFLKTSVKKKNEAQTVLTLDSSSGEITSFDLNNNLDQKVMLIGVPVPGNPYRELMMSLQFQFIQLIKKGEQND
ncbi:MAG: hypothetical protein ACI4OR_04330 [Alphaproteobacteria bacterium]